MAPTKSPPGARSAALPRGAQRPRIFWTPPAVSSAGQEAVDLARVAGLNLDPWQEFVLEHALGEDVDGQWAAFEVGVVVSRQNGKGSILEARELAGLFLLGERLLIHSAHEFPTSLEAFDRLLALIEENPDFDRRVQRVSRSHGEEGIKLKGGQRIRFRTRTKGGGRGFSCDCLILDEAMMLPETAHGALLPTLAARPNPQVWYTGSAVDQEKMEHGIVLARVRERGHAQDPGLAYFEWSPNLEIDEATTALERAMTAPVATDPAVWAQSNPGLGIRISHEHVGREQRSMDARTFAIERLSVGDWPRTDLQGGVIDLEAWEALADEDSKLAGHVCFAIDVRPDRSAAAIVAVGKRKDGRLHMEVVEHKTGNTGWVAKRQAELLKKHKNVGVVIDLAGPAASLEPALTALKIEVTPVNSQEHAQACGLMYDAVDQATLRHLGTAELAAAVKGAVKRPLGEAWAWSRKSSAVDISPLVAGTLALWGFITKPAPAVGGFEW